MVFSTYFLKDSTKKVWKTYKSIITEKFKPVPLCPINTQGMDIKNVICSRGFQAEMWKYKVTHYLPFPTFVTDH